MINFNHTSVFTKNIKKLIRQYTMLAFLLISPFIVFGQNTFVRKVRSDYFEDEREISIQLPKNYSQNTEKTYPLILTLDGDYLFDPMAGNVNYFSKWSDIPECIVVGIHQKNTRETDCSVDPSSFLPDENGEKFYDFISRELVSYLENNYRLAKFKMIVGHDYTGNFINYLIFPKNPIFQAFVNLSSDFTNTEKDIRNTLEKCQERTWYYMATSENDNKLLREKALSFHEKLQKIKNPKVSYRFDNFKESSHYSLVAYGIPKALEDIFSIYRPINKKEYKNVISNLETSAYEYLVNKYKDMEDLFGIKEAIRVNDFIAIATHLEKTENWEELEKLGALAQKTYPEFMLGNYYLAESYENTDRPKKAMHMYQSAYILKEISFLTKNFMLDKAQSIKDDFGY